MTIERKHSATAENNINEHLTNIDKQLKVLTRIYPDCETNSQVVASLLMTAACIRLQHMIDHNPNPTPAKLSDTMETLIDIITKTWTAAVPFAIAHGPNKPMDAVALIKEIITVIDSIKKDSDAMSNRKDFH